MKEFKELCKKCPIFINVFCSFCVVDATKYAEVTDIQIQDYVNNIITDGGVASPPLLLIIVMSSSNSKILRISRNSKDSREG